MQYSSVASSDLAFEHPPCEQCKAPMWLTRLKSGEPDHSKRTFECKACGATQVEIVKY